MDSMGDQEGPAAHATVGSLRRLAAHAAEGRSRALEPHGLDEGQFAVLEVLAAAGPPFRLTAGDLARHCRVTPGAISQRLTGMERSGLVERVREDPDRRTVHVQLTGSGRALLDAAAGDVADADRELLAALGREDREALDAILGRWLDGRAIV
jgi:DNA-binding MarR family transcriptional regulator